MFVYELFNGKKYKCTCHPGDPDPDCPEHGLEPMEVGDALDVKNEAKQRLDPKCWTGYKKQGTKMKGGVRVNNCVPANEGREHDEGNREPANNFAIYINNKKWKVLPGLGYYADDYREQAQYRKLKDWCQKKTQTTGKKWEVAITGEPATEGVAEGSEQISSMIQQYEDMVELVYDLPPGRKKNITINKRDALEAQIEAMPGGKEALRNWAKSYNDAMDEGVAEGIDTEEFANEVYAEFERIYPNLARRADERTIHSAIMDVLNYGGDNNAGALAQDVARAVKQQMQQGMAEGLGYSTDPEQAKWYHEGRNAMKFGTNGDTMQEIANKHGCPPEWLDAFRAGYKDQFDWNKKTVTEENKGLYYNVNKRKKAGTSRPAGHPKAPTAQAWKDAAKTAKK